MRLEEAFKEKEERWTSQFNKIEEVVVATNGSSFDFEFLNPSAHDPFPSNLP